MKLKKVIAAVLCAAVCLSFTGCVKNESPVVMSYGDRTVTADVYTYWLCTYKAYYLYTYSDVTDSEEFWTSEVTDGVTAEQYFRDMINENVKLSLVSAKLCDDLGLTVPDEFYDSLDDYMSDLLTEYADGNKSMLNLALSEFGINDKKLREIFATEQLSTILFNHMYGDGGTETVTDEMRDEYYRSGAYTRVQQIFINNAYVYEYDEDGNYTYDDDGNIVRSEMTGELLDAENAKVDAVKKGIALGEDFDELYLEYSEDQSYPNGYYLTPTTDFIDEVVSAAFSLDVGDTIRLESDYGTHFLKCLELDDKAWENEENSDFFDSFETDVETYLFRKYVMSYIDEVTVDEDALAEFDFINATPNYSFS
jgi:hypothetical protein